MPSRTGDARLLELAEWTKQTLRTGAFALAPASADASFRRYFRITPHAPWRGHVDADRDGRAAAARGLPSLRSRRGTAARRRPPCAGGARRRSRTSGFLLLTDLGTRTYLDALDAASAPALYADATDALIRWQQAHARRRAAAVRRGAARARARALSRLVCRPASRRRAHARRSSRRWRRRSAGSSTTISRSRACSSIATTIRAI